MADEGGIDRPLESWEHEYLEDLVVALSEPPLSVPLDRWFRDEQGRLNPVPHDESWRFIRALRFANYNANEAAHVMATTAAAPLAPAERDVFEIQRNLSIPSNTILELYEHQHGDSMRHEVCVFLVDVASAHREQLISNRSRLDLLHRLLQGRPIAGPEGLQAMLEHALGAGVGGLQTCFVSELPPPRPGGLSGEWQIAAGHFLRLMGHGGGSGNLTVTRVDKIDYTSESPVLSAYQDMKATFRAHERDADDFWVFHGTPDRNAILAIAQSGFRWRPRRTRSA